MMLKRRGRFIASVSTLHEIYMLLPVMMFSLGVSWPSWFKRWQSWQSCGFGFSLTKRWQTWQAADLGLHHSPRLPRSDLTQAGGREFPYHPSLSFLYFCLMIDHPLLLRKALQASFRT